MGVYFVQEMNLTTQTQKITIHLFSSALRSNAQYICNRIEKEVKIISIITELS